LLRLATVALLGGVFIAVAVLDTNAPASCGDAKRHLVGGDLKRAEEAYAAVAKSDSDAGCAVAGLQDTQCRQARRALAAGMPGEAQKKLLAILAGDPQASCAAEGLRSVAEVRCFRARELRYEGLIDEAVKAYTALLEVEPRPYCVPHQLKITLDKKNEKPGKEPSQPPSTDSGCCCCRQCGDPTTGNEDPCDQ
jgi:tetratricopeptide (TPR) repeat protein